MSWLLTEIAEAVQGKIINKPAAALSIKTVHFDSRKIEQGALFVPIIADRNGHDFVRDAFEQGAIASFWSDPLNDAPTDIPLIRVEDTLKAFQKFAQWHIRKSKVYVVGITGSNGKTTTKDMSAAVLSQKFKTHKTEANFNNEIGVPLTILSMPQDTEVAVIEMGMSAPHEIEALSKIAQPDIAVVTMIGESHIEAFDSRGGLATEKMSIIEGLKKNGLFIYPQNEPLINQRIPKNIRTQSFGDNADADLYAEEVVEKTDKTTFKLLSPKTNKKIHLTLPIPGRYNVNNALMAILVGLECGLEMDQIKTGLENFSLTANRLEWLTTANEVQLLNDAYNASPTSMKAVLHYFSQLEISGAKIAVLGDILELGQYSRKYHESIAEELDLEAFKAVYLYGEEMKALYQKLINDQQATNVEHFMGEKSSLINMIKKNSNPGDAVLFKSSNGTDLLAIVNVLKESQ